jgi:DnaK suppressor protein
MDLIELEKLKKFLLQEKTQIESELKDFTTKNPAIEDDYQSHFHKSDQSDTLDEKAHSVTDFEEDRAVEQNLELRLKEINETLKKIDGGSYGICDRCSLPIDSRRLKVMPAARFCVNCTKKVKLI